ncbi:radical SAM protein [Coleofasciculus sp. FACHB-1120]|uniref:radical SAM/SPASM domain-containing protein n=1 Tax=Coleofasciculus sp. FACHB-1120 TaxID=2692783 RepID=UPI00168892E7|nr:radical SAM protein [Coleofasciculus sp. FACHB-1120]MBD2744867.1 SPASM domain-containing protein [Coleofasciculus sp. FACHB-1120]
MAWLTKRRLSILAHVIKHPIKFWNAIGLIASYFFKLKKVPFLPVSIDIEPNNSCNFKCSHCQVTHWSKEIVYLDDESFNRIVDQFPNLGHVKLQGMGEPLLNKQFISMLKSGERRGLLMAFHSNASVCNQKIAEQLVSLKTTTINFSIDGATSETFENIRVNSNLNQIKKNIQYLSHIRGEKKEPKLLGWAVITDKNLHEVPQIVKLSKDLGLDSITIQPFLSNWGKEEMKKYTESIKVEENSEVLTDVLTEAKKLASEEQIDFNVNHTNLYSKNKKCAWAWMRTYIASNGDVVPCCVIADSDTVKMGNVFEKDFAEIWNSKEYQDFRERIRTHNLPDYCKNCYVDAD